MLNITRKRQIHRHRDGVIVRNWRLGPCLMVLTDAREVGHGTVGFWLTPVHLGAQFTIGLPERSEVR